MQAYFARETNESVCPIEVVPVSDFSLWLSMQPEKTQAAIRAQGFSAKPETYCLLLDEQGERQRVFLGVSAVDDLRAVGRLPFALPCGHYQLDVDSAVHPVQQALIYWGLGAYQFTRYRRPERAPAILLLPKNAPHHLVENIVEATHLGRDLINTPAEDLGPLDLAEILAEVGGAHQASVRQIVDEALLAENYPAIFAVGRAAQTMPRLIELIWGELDAPKVTLVGKGVCFDTGGLNLKGAEGMALMKKDMGGAAHVIALAMMIMQERLPVRLRVLVPAVENAISGDAYRPGDVIRMRNGKTVEVTNTDAEGRLVLADALADASAECPELLIDFATLTGAARVALGPQIGNMFGYDARLLAAIAQFSMQEQDLLWPMPLHLPYKSYLKSLVADFTNSSSQPAAGAITAALFLSEFVTPGTPWIHCDVSGWSFDRCAGHPEGGDLLGVRAMFMYLRQRYSSRH